MSSSSRRKQQPMSPAMRVATIICGALVFLIVLVRACSGPATPPPVRAPDVDPASILTPSAYPTSTYTPSVTTWEQPVQLPTEEYSPEPLPTYDYDEPPNYDEPNHLPDAPNVPVPHKRHQCRDEHGRFEKCGPG